MKTASKVFAAVTLAVVLNAVPWLGAPVSQAADHSNLEEGLPVQVEDAYPIAYRGQELQNFVREFGSYHREGAPYCVVSSNER